MKTSKQNIELSLTNFRKNIDWKYVATKNQQSNFAFIQ